MSTALVNAAFKALRALKEDRPIRAVRAIAERPDGVRRWFTPHPTPLHNGAGALIGGINLFLDQGIA